jgi:hypothetical protein
VFVCGDFFPFVSFFLNEMMSSSPACSRKKKPFQQDTYMIDAKTQRMILS